MRLLQALRRTDRQIEDIRAWLMGTASNLVNDFYRNKYRQPVDDLAEREDIPEPQSIEVISEHNERLDEVSRCIRRLTPEQQHVLALRFSQELSLIETANIVGRSVNAVKVIQFRALAALRRLLGESKEG
jgi:RNA polymerase sigma-70 factor (ECF subfamily)